MIIEEAVQGSIVRKREGETERERGRERQR